MGRKGLYLVIGGLSLALIALGYNYYREQQKSGIAIEINEDGIKVEEQ